MKRKLSKAGGKALSVALAMATVVSAAPFSVAAEDNVALAQTQETEGNALRLWYDEEAPNSYTGWEQWCFPNKKILRNSPCLPACKQKNIATRLRDTT